MNASVLCDGNDDCEDNSDENTICSGAFCSTEMFIRGNRTCVSSSLACNEDNGCVNNSDQETVCEDIRIRKTESGTPCEIPFAYKEQTYDTCVNIDNGGVPWCYTNLANQEWETCNKTNCLNLRGNVSGETPAAFVFPSVVKKMGELFEEHNFLVPGTFFNKEPPACRNNNLLGCYCLKANNKCRKILWFLSLDGRFSAKSNIEVIYHEAMTLYNSKFVGSFDELIDEIIYPIFFKKFSKKYEFLRRNSMNRYREIEKINSKRKCVLDGPNCYGALNGMNRLLNKFFRKFSVLNKEFDPRIPSSAFGAERHYGTLLANINFLLEENRFNGNQPNVGSFQIQNDLTKLLQAVMPSPNISLFEFLGLLGYGDVFSPKNIDSKTVLTTNTIQPEKVPCDTGQLLQDWNAFYLSLLKKLEDTHLFIGIFLNTIIKIIRFYPFSIFYI